MEIWKEIKGYESYEVSNLGRVKSLKYNKERILKPALTGSSCLGVSLAKNGKAKTKKIHQLVAEAFLNHIPDGYKLVVDHIDNNPLNNELGNLQIITNRENSSKDKKGFSSEHVGVNWNKASKKWKTQIRINGKQTHLGMFTNELEASKAYQNALLEMVK